MNRPQWNRASVEAWMAGAARVPLLAAAEEVHLGTAIQIWQQHPAGPDKAPPAIRRRGLRARDRMVTANLRLVGSAVAKSRTRLEFDDACQAATIGLQRAAEKFDPTRGYKFSTYAYWWIRQAICRADEEHAATIRSPGHIQQKRVRINRLAADLHQQLGRPPTMGELAEGSGLAAEVIREMINRSPGCVSLDMPVGDGNARLMDSLPDPASADHLERLEEGIQVDRLQEGLAQLQAINPDAAQLLRELFGVDGSDPPSLAAIGRRLGCSREAVRQARDRAVLKLRGLVLRQELQEQGCLDL